MTLARGLFGSVGVAALLFCGTARADHDHMGHGTVEGPAAAPPAVALDVSADSVAGYNLHLSVENFIFTPEAAGAAHVDGTGHAHLYVDGAKTTRIYAPWHHLGPLGPGSHEIRVTLNANDHRGYVVGDAPVAAVAFIEVAGADDALAGRQVIDLEIQERAVTGDSQSVRVTEGQRIALRWRTDEAVSLHLHGYDIELAVAPGTAAVMLVDAQATGRFPITSHGFGGDHHDGGELTLIYFEVYPD